MEIEKLSEVDQTKQVKETVRNLERQAFVAQLAVAVGAGPQETADNLEKQAAKAREAAGARGVSGPYFTVAEQYAIHHANVMEIERAFIDAEIRKAAGDENADPDKLAEQKAALVAVTPPEPDDPASIRHIGVAERTPIL